MSRTRPFLVSLALCLAVLPGSAAAAGPTFTDGAAGVGDPYYPNDGNGGYDVRHYDLDLRYDPATDALAGSATITARATQNLSRFNLDLDGLTVRSIAVNGRSANWSRADGELRIKPRSGLARGSSFTTVVRYDGVPAFFDEPALGTSGFFHTDDGALVAGQPHGASGWFPVNDHPIDKASYSFQISVPAGLQAVANGRLVDTRTKKGWTTWMWEAREPMASYLTTLAIGTFDLKAYRRAGIRYWDAVDPDLYLPPAAPRSGSYLAMSQPDDAAYKRLATTISVPAGGATLSFWVTRATEASWDYLAVEAHRPGKDDWTTLPDANGHTSQEGGGLCRYSVAHPFLAHYMTPLPPADPDGEPGCDPVGTTGAWHAASGSSDGYEAWAVDLGAYAGGDVEVSISYITDESFQLPGLFVDDVNVSAGAGSTGFEAGSLAPWVVSGAPGDSPGNLTDWVAATAADVPAPTGDGIRATFAREPEFIRFLGDTFGSYPFSTAGGIVDDFTGLGFALETQTRPVYSRDFFGSPEGNDFVFVHELAHQWYGDSLAVARWQDIWLNEGFATYAEWLWSEHEGFDTAQQVFDFWSTQVWAPDDPFWSLTIGDPGPDRLFDFAVYVRGAMTLHALRLEIGDDTFFELLKKWASSRAGGNVTTDEFIGLAERLSGRDLGAFFETWLYTGAYPLPVPVSARSMAGTTSLADAPAAVRSLYARYGKDAGVRIGH
ncbi:MAG TPA: M1 family metallopeptidase [Candidatus Limnocylindrales bacterium]|nr:M1 family metallopeptidase [Candidatus Limnocylindrales bacterium]